MRANGGAAAIRRACLSQQRWDLSRIRRNGIDTHGVLTELACQNVLEVVDGGFECLVGRPVGEVVGHARANGGYRFGH